MRNCWPLTWRVILLIQVWSISITCAEFDKLQPWGPNEYGCMTLKGPAEHSKIEANSMITLDWSALSCGHRIATGLLAPYDLRLYNNLRVLPETSNSENLVGYDMAVLISDSIDNNTSSYTWKVPNIDDSSINENQFFLRVASQYLSHPKKPTIFAVTGPFSILKPQNIVLPELPSNQAYSPSKIEPPKNSSKLTSAQFRSHSNPAFGLVDPSLTIVLAFAVLWSFDV
ncbi:hypothetical protein K493DRAFT_301097 [Basidiobolus meristosporus CBS 931.73]|uniref:Uncharacterized protein n=1 Tax=Basidiobolus meristosporus CBS 931.73 TaxID=1314790 RepID=A0A1Y1YDP2_9FUNG|nr:hypothetical protein K493DRAFT_301097 [Basidiobolus meristosporus CBS 931.73]|eukprot:ORX96088.1 hypothetical protein K493DRAFT_301097 [Basidiobolus meristosporus CBS 931.73]